MFKAIIWNPFVPNGDPTSERFAGRSEEIESAERSLVQACNHTPEHFLFEGERGIGKTALMSQVRELASGRIRSEISDETYNFICVSVELGGCESQMQIVQKIVSELIWQVEDLKTINTAKKFLDFCTRFEGFGFKFNKKAEDEQDIDGACIEFVQMVTGCVKSGFFNDGILFLLDEADAPPSSANLGQLLKSLCEKLEKMKCKNAIFGIAGLPTLRRKLAESHGSAPRLFKVNTLTTMSDEDCEKGVNLCIKMGNDVNKDEHAKTMTPEAMKKIIAYAEGYPHFLQQFCSCAWQEDTDNVICENDVEVGAHHPQGAIAQLGKKFFDSMYFDSIGSDSYRHVLDVMAQYEDRWVKKSEIGQTNQISDSQLKSALKVLTSKEIILKDPARDGYYRLPTKSFGVWINKLGNKSLDQALSGV